MSLLAGAAVADVTPTSPMFLFGYPHTPRTSTGVNDPLLSVAVCLEQDGQVCLFIANDQIFVSRPSTRRVRARIAKATGIAVERILIGASHTHSGPVTLDYLSMEGDPVVPKTDPNYLKHMEGGMVRAGVDAWTARRPAEAAYVTADATGIGTNRHDPAGPSDLATPVLSIRDAATHSPIALLVVCTMHPTVLHADSTVISGDFPAATRTYLQREVVGKQCPIAYFMGAAGDQSPRHVTKSKTVAECERLGEILGRAVETSLKTARYSRDLPITAKQEFVDLPSRIPPNVDDAEKQMNDARARLYDLCLKRAAPTEIRTAECDWFGAEETLAIAKAAAAGRVEKVLADCLPAEIQVLAVGPNAFVAWPGEFFVDFQLTVRKAFPTAAVITCANGDLQGYVVTQDAVDHNRYEAGNALLQSPQSGDIVVQRTLAMLRELPLQARPKAVNV